MINSKKRLTNKIVGREREKEVLTQLLISKKSEFLALYGRRRIGKTFLIRNFFSQTTCLFFNCTGIQDGKLSDQLTQFSKQIGSIFYGGAAIVTRSRWLDAFEDLQKAIESTNKQEKIVLFFDEFPWMVTKRSGLLQALEYYWNHYWSQDPRIKVIICGSSASWIIEKIINNKAGLYNRVTRVMRLSPFTLSESRAFLTSLGVKLSQKQVLDLYMVLGGVPHYLALVTRGLSAHQCIDDLFFHKDGALVNEFDRLFASLFQESETYIKIIRIIAKYRYGIGQAQLIHESGASEGGRIVSRLKELEEAGFIHSFLPIGHQEKGVYFKIIDEYVLFYLQWIEQHLFSIRKLERNQGYWISKAQSPKWKSWAGYAFEAICNKHLTQIRKALKIDPGADAGSWRYVPRNQKDNTGAQIDLLFDRPDGTVTICEIKYSDRPFTIDKRYHHDLQSKIDVYKKYTKTKKHIFLAMITCSGLKPSKYVDEIVDQQTNLDVLFE